MDFLKGVAVWVVAFLVADGVFYIFRRRKQWPSRTRRRGRRTSIAAIT